MTRITFVSMKRLYRERQSQNSHLPLLPLCSVSSSETQHPLPGNTSFPRLCLDLYGCAQLLAPVFAFSSNFLARAGTGAESGRSDCDRRFPPPVLPHTPLEGGTYLTLCNPACTVSRLDNIRKQNPAQTKREGCSCSTNDVIPVEICFFGYIYNVSLTIE